MRNANLPLPDLGCSCGAPGCRYDATFGNPLRKPRVRLPKANVTGEKRQWVKCRTCGTVAYYDYIPYGLSNPIMVLGCGHTPVVVRNGDIGADRITAEEAEPLYLQQAYDRAVAVRRDARIPGAEHA